MLQIENISKTYDPDGKTVAALKNVSLDLDGGQFKAIRGLSGCGKSTLLLAAGGLARPDEGRVRFEGQDIYALTPADRAVFRADKVGFVFQQFHLVPYLDALDNVLAASLGLSKDASAVRQRAEQLLDQFGMTHRLHHTPAELSTGERQRTALARALLNEPKIILADEPTGNLDSENAKVVLDELDRFVSEGGAVMLVTHDEQAAERATEQVLMAKGAIVKPDEVPA